jgi:hypothetical protein
MVSVYAGCSYMTQHMHKICGWKRKNIKSFLAEGKHLCIIIEVSRAGKKESYIAQCRYDQIIFFSEFINSELYLQRMVWQIEDKVSSSLTILYRPAMH